MRPKLLQGPDQCVAPPLCSQGVGGDVFVPLCRGPSGGSRLGQTPSILLPRAGVSASASLEPRTPASGSRDSLGQDLGSRRFRGLAAGGGGTATWGGTQFPFVQPWGVARVLRAVLRTAQAGETLHKLVRGGEAGGRRGRGGRGRYAEEPRPGKELPSGAFPAVSRYKLTRA